MTKQLIGMTYDEAIEFAHSESQDVTLSTGLRQSFLELEVALKKVKLSLLNEIKIYGTDAHE